MKTWKEKIIDAMTGRNKRNIPLWYSNSEITKAISKNEGRDISETYRSLTCYLYGLVKSGHLERAIMPRHLSRKVQGDGKPEYLYRRTSKPYVRGYVGLSSSKNRHTDAERIARQAHDLWRVHPTLPKWFRRMMLD